MGQSRRRLFPSPCVSCKYAIRTLYSPGRDATLVCPQGGSLGLPVGAGRAARVSDSMLVLPRRVRRRVGHLVRLQRPKRHQALSVLLPLLLPGGRRVPGNLLEELPPRAPGGARSPEGGGGVFG